MPAKSRSLQRLMQADEAAYLAGFFDGEGTIGIREHNKPGTVGGHDRRTPHYRLVVSITNRDIAVLQWIADIVGGTVHPKSRGSDRWAPAWEWSLSNRAGVELMLTAIRPHLKVKARHVDVGLAFLRLGLSRVTFTARGKTWPRRIQHPDDVQARKTLKTELNRLNGKGLAYAV